MSFQCFMDNCDWGCAETLEHILSEHFINSHGSIRIVELPLDNMQINCHQMMGKQEKELISVPYVIQYGGYNLLLCVSWGARFECWTYKLNDKPFVEDGRKLELTMKLNSVNENLSDKLYDPTKESVFFTNTTPSEIISAQSGLSISWKAMEKNFIKTESSNPESSFITLTIEFCYNVLEEEEPEIEQVLENKEDEVAQQTLVLETQEICEELSNSATLPSVCKGGKRKGELFKCPNCLTQLTAKMIFRSFNAISTALPKSHSSFEGESSSAASIKPMKPETQLSCDNPQLVESLLESSLGSSDIILQDSPLSTFGEESSSVTPIANLQPETQLSSDNLQSVKALLESSLGNSDPILQDTPLSTFVGETSSATPIANLQPETQLSCDNQQVYAISKKHQSRVEQTCSSKTICFTDDDEVVLNLLRNFPLLYENPEEKVPSYRYAKEEDKPMLKDLILISAGYKPSNASESDERQ